MIAPPTRAAASARVPCAAESALPDPDDADSAEPPSALEARIAALVARAHTPEDEELDREREAFDFITRAQAETDRETNALRDMAMEQMKHEDELLKKWIELI